MLGATNHSKCFCWKDRKSWGMQATAVLDAAVSALKLEAMAKKEGMKK